MRRDGDGAGKGTALRREQEALPVSVLCPLIEQDDVQALKQAIQEDEGAVNAPAGPWRRTLLMTASELGKSHCAQALLAKGARVATMDAEGSTALHLASARGHDAVVHLLLLHNADVFQLDGWGSSPLALAAANGHAPVVRRLLLRIQQLQPPPRRTPRSLLPRLAADVVSPASLGAGSPPGEGETAIDAGAVDSVNKFGRTPLWRAACGGHGGVCRLLLQAGADPGLEDDQGTDARAIALDRGHDAVVSLIDSWVAATSANRGGGLLTVSPYSTSSDGQQQQQEEETAPTAAAAAAHVVIPLPALS